MREKPTAQAFAGAAVAAAAFIALAIGFITPATCGAVAPGSSVGDALDEALRAIMMTRNDLSFRTDYADQADSFRIAIVDSLLANPLSTPAYVRGFAEELLGLASLERRVVACAGELDLEVDAGALTEVGAELKEGTPEAIEILLGGVATASREIDAAFASLSAAERRFLADHAAELLEEEEFDPTKPIDQKEKEEKQDEETGDRILEIAERVDYARIATAGAAVARAVDLAETKLSQIPRDRPERAPATALASGDVIRVIETRAGTAILGGPGPTFYRGHCAVVVDLGGDDVYAADVAGTSGDGAAGAIVIDLSGNDTYLSQGHSLGGGTMGVGILLDIEGDDTYSAGNYSLGSGLFGVGVLLDRDGNDTYIGDTCVQGSGAFGIGILVDESGNDRYQSAVFSQAFGFVMGVGLLDDAEGNDLYFAGWKYTDEIRYFDHFLSLSQGFGFGWRPDASGGIGLLVDRGGNDIYASDIFGQGSSYWFAVGGLVDYAGNDYYVSYQYAQGAATHITVAALVDMGGDDNYVSKGVSQGCGHDLAIGFLHDLSGDDNYTCHDLSQAAGNANGIGILLDERGDDSYSVRNPDNTHGYGDLRRDYGSIGLLIDCGGKDDYSGRGDEGSWWTYSNIGAGLDFELAEVAARGGTSSAADEAREEKPVAPAGGGEDSGEETRDEPLEREDLMTELSDLTSEELFLRASSSELQFADMREPSRALLIEEYERSLPYLVTKLDTDGARERHALEDIIVKIGKPAVEAVAEAVRDELENTETTRGVRLGAGILGRLGDASAVSSLVGIAPHADWKVRGSVAGALGRIGGSDAVAPLTELLGDANEIVRKSSAVALARAAEDSSVVDAVSERATDSLIVALADPFYSVRYSAARALVALGDRAGPKLLDRATNEGGVERCLAVWTLGEIGWRGSIEELWKLAESDDWALRGFAVEAIAKMEPGSSDWKRLEEFAAGEDHPFALMKAVESLAPDAQ